MDTLAGRTWLRAGTRGDILTNRLVLVTKQRRGALRGLARRLATTKLALADPGAVPAGHYAKASLESLGHVGGGRRPNVVPAENVRAALALVERGEAPLGMVYATDAHASRRRCEWCPDFPKPAIRRSAIRLARAAGSDQPRCRGFRRLPRSSGAGAGDLRAGFGLPE